MGKRAAVHWRRERATRIGLGLLGTYTALFVLNLAAPLLLPAWLVERPNAIGLPDGLMVPDPDLGYVYRPEWTGEFEGKPAERVGLRINSDGWRDEPFDPPGVGRPRILAVGDSIVMGVGVEAEARFTERLEELMPGCRVDSCGAAGYELNQVIAAARRMMPKCAPQIVLYGMCLNDLRVADLGEFQGTDERRLWLRMRAALELRNLARVVSNLWLIRGHARAARAVLPSHAEQGTMQRWTDSAERASVAGQLADLKRLCDAAGARLLVVVFPYSFQFGEPDDHPVRAPQRYAAAMLADLAVPSLDLYQPLSLHGTELYLPLDHCHPNAGGHALVADEVAEWLWDLGLVDRPPQADDSRRNEADE